MCICLALDPRTGTTVRVYNTAEMRDYLAEGWRILRLREARSTKHHRQESEEAA